MLAHGDVQCKFLFLHYEENMINGQYVQLECIFLTFFRGDHWPVSDFLPSNYGFPNTSVSSGFISE
jgi:hypothetical protein